MGYDEPPIDYYESAAEHHVQNDVASGSMENISDEVVYTTEPPQTTDEKKDQTDYDASIAEVSMTTVEWVAQQLLIPPSELDGSYPEDVHYMARKVEEMSNVTAASIIRANIDYHMNDKNLPAGMMDECRDLLEEYTHGPEGEKEDEMVGDYAGDDFQPENSLMMRYYAALFHDWSPYPQVRSVTTPIPADPNEHVETIRCYIVGTIWVAISAFVNQFFYPRQPAISLTTPVLQLFLYPSGVLLQYILPKWGFKLWGIDFALNPGPWSAREQLMATLMCSVAAVPPYINSNIIVQYLPMFYDQSWALGFGYMFLFMLVTQYMGFGLAGLLRRVAVYPTRAFWPTSLPTLAVNKALLDGHRKETVSGWKITEYQAFMMFGFGAFLYFWVPNYLFTALSTFNWMSWIAPNNINLATVTGSVTGMGFNPIATFDWSVITALVQPVYMPLYTIVTQYVGFVLSGLCILGVWYSNYYNTAYLPINSNDLFDNTGQPFEVAKVLTNSQLDEDKYHNYSPPYYTAANLVLYGIFFAIYPMSFFYYVANEWSVCKQSVKDIWLSIRYLNRSNYEGRDDPFSRQMAQYKEVPDWWYYAILIVMFGLTVAFVEHWEVQTPVWSIVLILCVTLVFLFPFTIVMSATGAQLTLNVILELIMGYTIAGRPIGINVAKAFAVQIQAQAQNLSSDQKIGHYMALRPRSMLRVQLWATMVNGLVTIGVIQFQLTKIEHFCDIKYQKEHEKFTCPNERTFFTASVIWGLFGPKRMFDNQYPVLRWAFLMGFGVFLLFWGVQTVLPWALVKKYPQKERKIRKWQDRLMMVNPVLVAFGGLSWAPYNLSYMTGGLYIAVLFSYYLRKYYTAWWKKYTYVINAALTTGTALSGIIIFFAVQYTNKDLSWWGNNVPFAGQDGAGPPLMDIPADPGYFGPPPSHYP
ncbi:OPT oligopeptide transporter protein-domain-containing protein [Yarrowia lipolytica]|nr:OPT oligopeptide transporter protein-domain-containing protein [Yarrowia lipolytica]RDW40348.1 OPT oligopeptide transporter protein-domain-containing protein [Yarrowia lipolytica]RDW45639.1 OPT oligopeptide transporter protein-domain-containing protein [Yarrowia lipolytica]RDW53631.1 OPT oligopeptide transporter protein-domain-containing protein [Yarrowia lipolytica]